MADGNRVQRMNGTCAFGLYFGCVNGDCKMEKLRPDDNKGNAFRTIARGVCRNDEDCLEVVESKRKENPEYFIDDEKKN